MFIGRKRELARLEDAFNALQSQVVVIYGRRRIGKSRLVHKFGESKPAFFYFEAIEGERTRGQISHFVDCLKRQVSDSTLEHVNFTRWEHVFSYITERIIERAVKTERIVLFLDELQWMSAGRSRLVSILKYYWDNHWKNKNIMLILCGSVSSFMIKKVLRSKALYGRINVEMNLKGFPPREAAQFFKGKRSKEEILKYLLVFGGVPKYLEEIKLNRSFNQNMNQLCFSAESPMIHEIDRIFYSQFREARTYLRIVTLLKRGIHTLKDISEKLNIPSGGGLKKYLKSLEEAEIIRSYIPFGASKSSRLRVYSLADEFLSFYYKYIEPNLEIIQQGGATHLFERLTRESRDPWFGLAFERFCIKHSFHLAKIMGFEEEILNVSPFFQKGERSFQIDLIYKRADRVVTVCEVKYHSLPVSTKIIPEMNRKCSLLKIPRGHSLEKALISLHGADQGLRDSEYFDHIVSLEEIVPK